MSNRSSNVAFATNGWVYEQVCLAEYSNLPINLMANLLIYRVMCRFLLTNLI